MRMTHDGYGGSKYVARMLQYAEELISWIRLFGYGYLDLGGWLPGWYVVEDDNNFRWKRM